MKGGIWGHIDHFKNLGFNDIGGWGCLDAVNKPGKPSSRKIN